MNAHDQLARYREAMGDDATTRALARDGRNTDGDCETCRAPLGRQHATDCKHHPANVAGRVKATA